jgi:hypothetical protein
MGIIGRIAMVVNVALLGILSAQQAQAQCLACPNGASNCQHYCDDLRQQEDRRSSKRSYGAIAYSASTKKYGSSWGRSTQREAESRAIHECILLAKAERDCIAHVFFYNSCGAIASGDDEVVSWGRNDRESQAQQDALSGCVKNEGKNCEVITSQCSQ